MSQTTPFLRKFTIQRKRHEKGDRVQRRESQDFIGSTSMKPLCRGGGSQGCMTKELFFQLTLRDEDALMGALRF